MLTLFVADLWEDYHGGVFDVLGLPDYDAVLFDLEDGCGFDLILHEVSGIRADCPQILLG